MNDCDRRLREIVLDWLRNVEPPAEDETDTRAMRSYALKMVLEARQDALNEAAEYAESCENDGPPFAYGHMADWCRKRAKEAKP